MALIRQADFSGRDAIVLDLGDVSRQAERIKAAARAEADRIAAAARDEREQILAGAAEEGRKQGFEQGMAAGKADGEKQAREQGLAEARPRLERLEQAWAEALGAFESRREEMLREARHDVLRLSVLMAEKVTKRAVSLSETVAADQLAAVLTMIVRPTRLVVAVHPDDEAGVRTAAPALVERFVAGSHVEFATDAAVAPGSCVVRTPGGGEIDASVQTQLDRIVEALLPGATRAVSARGEHDSGQSPRVVAQKRKRR